MLCYTEAATLQNAIFEQLIGYPIAAGRVVVLSGIIPLKEEPYPSTSAVFASVHFVVGGLPVYSHLRIVPRSHLVCNNVPQKNFQLLMFV